MDGLRQYVISVTAAALICSILCSITQNSKGKELFRFLCGLFLLFVVIRPVARFNYSDISYYFLPFVQEAADTTASGESMAQESIADIIKSETEAYILDKAAALNARLSVEITLDADNLPAAATLHGEVSPYIRQRMESILETDLGITKENQQWTG